jgi:hypothetical protein
MYGLRMIYNSFSIHCAIRVTNIHALFGKNDKFVSLCSKTTGEARISTQTSEHEMVMMYHEKDEKQMTPIRKATRLRSCAGGLSGSCV